MSIASWSGTSRVSGEEWHGASWKDEIVSRGGIYALIQVIGSTRSPMIVDIKMVCWCLTCRVG